MYIYMCVCVCVCVCIYVCVCVPLLHQDVLVGHQASVPVVTPLPPVMWRPLEELQRRPLLEGELAARPARVVEPRHRLHALALCRGEEEEEEGEEEEDMSQMLWTWACQSAVSEALFLPQLHQSEQSIGNKFFFLLL